MKLSTLSKLLSVFKDSNNKFKCIVYFEEDANRTPWNEYRGTVMPVHT